MHELDRIVSELQNPAARRSFPDLPEDRNVYYAVWVDSTGAYDLSAVSPEPITEGIVYVGECVDQSVHRHLAHHQIGSLTLMKNLAALFRESWGLRATRRGERLQEPGLGLLRGWMAEHLTATSTPRHIDISTKQVLAAFDRACASLDGGRSARFCVST